MFKAILKDLRSVDSVSELTFTTNYQQNSLEIKMISLDVPSYISIGSYVTIGAKSSDIIISTLAIKSSSLTNEIPCTIKDIEKGEILTTLSLVILDSNNNDACTFESIITTDSFTRLNLSINLKVFAYIKATSIYIKD